MLRHGQTKSRCNAKFSMTKRVSPSILNPTAPSSDRPLPIVACGDLRSYLHCSAIEQAWRVCDPTPSAFDALRAISPSILYRELHLDCNTSKFGGPAKPHELLVPTVVTSLNLTSTGMWFPWPYALRFRTRCASILAHWFALFLLFKNHFVLFTWVAHQLHRKLPSSVVIKNSWRAKFKTSNFSENSSPMCFCALCLCVVSAFLICIHLKTALSFRRC